MIEVRQLAHDSSTNRSLHVLSVPSASDIPTLHLSSDFIIALLVWDSVGSTEEELLAVGKSLIESGVVYACCWGPGCEAAHDAIDHADRGSDRPDDAVLMTTWHDNEPLSEALWFFLNTAIPTEPYVEGCRASIAIVVDNEAWADECVEALSHPREFTKRVLG